MKRLRVLLILAPLLGLALCTPVLADGIGVSPAAIELELPADGSAEVSFYITSDGFAGDVEIGLEDIPLRIEPEVVHLEDSPDPQQVVLTFYGDESLGEQTFHGKITFLAASGGTIGYGIKVKADITQTMTQAAAATQGLTMPAWGWIVIALVGLGIAILGIFVILK